ncbi:hypothetical protein PIB30_065480 [Stylosanthes scabra]|uniref:Uncharacterized protein n=1 Tax=Stylosanthes scabra TaxID=79078 RepID=A0ABU6QN49_9FABA|nr:hypothetical protein [Stylosanthes scabra]
MSFKFLDRECKYLCEIEAAELVKLLNDKDTDEHPIAFDKMLEMKLLFKVNVKASNIQESDTTYAVMKICDDDEMVKKYQPIGFETNACVTPNDVGASNSVDMSGITVNLESDVDTQPVGHSLENSVNSIKSKVPVKKSNDTLKSCIKNIQKKESGQSSTNRFIKKGQKKGVKRVRMILDDTSE